MWGTNFGSRVDQIGLEMFMRMHKFRKLRRFAVCFSAASALCLLLIKAADTQQVIELQYTVSVLDVPELQRGFFVTGIGTGQPAGTAGSPQHAYILSGNDYSYVDLHIATCTNTQINAAYGKMQVGSAMRSGKGGFTHAALWRGSAKSAVDLNPEGANRSEILGCGGTQQVGFAVPSLGSVPSGPEQAALWFGSAQSAISLHPKEGYMTSKAEATDGKRQVGTAYLDLGRNGIEPHAMLWSGTAASAVDLTPTGWRAVYATGIDGNTQVGHGGPPGSPMEHAVLWHGTAKSVVDLNPAGCDGSIARALHGNVQVGQSWGVNPHALLWRGTAESAFDLSKLLPKGFNRSNAVAIDELGNIVGTAFDENRGRQVIIIWKPTTAVGR